MRDKPIKLFYSYSQIDEALREKIEAHLKVLERQGYLKGWRDRDIEAGGEWATEIDKNLNDADIILLLVSANFLASDYCYGIEMARAMQRHEAGEACVIPVILRPCLWQKASFGKLKALPKDGKPIISWKDEDEALLSVAEGISRVIDRLTSPP